MTVCHMQWRCESIPPKFVRLSFLSMMTKIVQNAAFDRSLKSKLGTGYNRDGTNSAELRDLFFSNIRTYFKVTETQK